MIYTFNAAEVLQMAIDIERNGLNFYREARKKVNDPELEKMLRFLEEAEAEHERKFESLKSLLPASAKKETVWDPENETNQYLQMMADMHVFTRNAAENALAGATTPKDILKTAIQFEKDSILFFLALEEATEEDTARRQLDLLVREERQHLRTLAIKLARLTQG